MDNSNPYAPPRSALGSAPRRRRVSATSVFVVSAEIAFLSLLFAPSQPHPAPYTATEQFLVTLTSSWGMIVTFVLTAGAFATIVFVSSQRLKSWFAATHMNPNDL